MAGFSIDIFSNVRDVQRGAKDVEKSFEDVADALDDVARGADKDGKRLEKALGDSVKDGAKDADRALDGVGKSYKELADTARRSSADGADAMARNTKTGTSRAKADLDELKNEAKQNASETFSSFDGSAQSFADGIQGTLGGIVSSLGPIGAAAGAAGALGIGLIIAAFDSAGTKSEDYKAKVSELASQLIETGNLGAPAIEFIVEKLRDLATETDDAKTSLDDLRKASDDSGSSYKDLAEAYTGMADGLDDLWDAADKRQAQMQDDLKLAEQNHSATADELRDMQSKIDAQGRYRDYIGEARQAQQDAAADEQNYADAGGKAMETRAKAVETYQEALDDSLGAFAEFKDAETGAFDPAAYLASMQARMDATNNFNSNVQTIATQFGLTDAEVQAILDQGVDFAPYLQSIIDAGLTGTFVDQMKQAVGGGQEVLDGSGLSATAEIDADTDKATDKTDAFTSQKRETTITAKADTKAAESQIRSVAGAGYNATITADAATGSAQSAVDSFIRRNDGRSFTIVQKVVDRNGTPVE